jgi:anti-anti-sigma factor
MSLHINIRQTGEVVVLQCRGRIVRDHALHLLKQAVTTPGQSRVILLDLSGVETLDGGGLGMLVFLHGWTRSKGIRLMLVNPPDFVREMLDRTQLTSLLHVSSLSDAVEVICNGKSSSEKANRVVA